MGFERGLGIVKKNYNITVQKGRLAAEQMDKRLGLISGTTDYEGIADVDLVIEAVFENLDLKEIFAKLDGVCKPGAILATNTSYQDVDTIAEATARPQDVVGMHFFSPANVMKLLEVVRVKRLLMMLATVMQIGKRIKKVCALFAYVMVIGNRMLSGYGRSSNASLGWLHQLRLMVP